MYILNLKWTLIQVLLHQIETHVHSYAVAIVHINAKEIQKYNVIFTVYLIVLSTSVQLAIVVTDVYMLQSNITITQYFILPVHSQK